MPGKGTQRVGPRGGLRASARALRGWKWNTRGKLVSDPVRCKREEWYLARARLSYGVHLPYAELLLVFQQDGRTIGQQLVQLHTPAGLTNPDEMLGWFQTPPKATHLQLCVPHRALVGQVDEITFHNVAERDPKCHPLANVPRWSAQRPPFEIRQVLLPPALFALADHLGGLSCTMIEQPASFDELRDQTAGTACVLDPRWVGALRLTWSQLLRLAEQCWLIVDLDTMARLTRQARVANTEIITHASAHGLMSARNDYADVATRGLALQDVVPLAIMSEDGGFRTRVLHANRSWQKFADSSGCATLLSVETPWAEHHGDVLTAALPTSGGELITTDLPWLVTGRFGALAAPHIATHLLRMHLGAPLSDWVQYWNRWEEFDVVVRDLSDLAERYPPLQALRWAAPRPQIAHLGVALVPDDAPPTRHTMITTGRIDTVAEHDGLPPEPLAIFMKFLAREWREQTDWARQHLCGHVVTWQFDTAAGLKYASNYLSAEPIAHLTPQLVPVRKDLGVDPPPAPTAARLAGTEGLFGDRSLAYQAALYDVLRSAIEASAPS